MKDPELVQEQVQKMLDATTIFSNVLDEVAHGDANGWDFVVYTKAKLDHAIVRLLTLFMRSFR